MSQSSVIISLLSSMRGVYRDTSRVTEDTTEILRSSHGRYITAGSSALVQNDGTYLPSVLNLTGTIAMTYARNTYHIPIEIFIPPLYPVDAPIVFVRPVANMVIQDPHPHVATDGRVHIPYLTTWNTHNCNLIDCCSSMSHLFGLNPPVFSRPVTAVPVSSSATLEEDIVRQVDEANAAVQAARLAEQEEDKQRIELQQLRSNLNWKIYSILQEFKKLVDESIVQEVRHHQDLALSKQYLQQHQFEYLTERRETLSKYDQDLSDSILRMQNYISQVQEEEQKHKDSESTNTVNPDTLAIPADLHSKKLLFLTAQNVALSDAFYYLDKTLEAGAITLDRHLRTVRQLARRQFYIRAHLSKVKQDGN